MKSTFYNTIAGIVLFFAPLLSKSQNFDEELFLRLSENNIEAQLPPLQSLLDSAEKHSPLLKILDADIIIQQLKIKSEKREWMRSLGFEAGARYGLFDNLILKEDLGADDLATSTTEQTRYNLGLFLKIPLASIADKSNIQLAREEKNRLKFERENSIRELRKLIIIQYNNLLSSHKKMIINSQQVELFRVQIMRAEKEYENGVISAADYARLSQMFSSAKIAEEESKAEFITAFQLLRESVGITIKLKPDKN